MKLYRELLWPRFWPFLRVKDEMPSHRINLHLYTSSFLICGGMIWGYSAWPAPSWVALIMVAAGFALLRLGPLRLIKAPPRQASNYLVTIVAKQGLPEHTLQQEIYESRYWLAHPWRLVDFFWFYCGPAQRILIRPAVTLGDKLLLYRIRKRENAAAHLARVECASRAQEIRAKWDVDGDESVSYLENEWKDWEAKGYAESIHDAPNYAFFAAAGWDEERVYQEIVRHL